MLDFIMQIVGKPLQIAGKTGEQEFFKQGHHWAGIPQTPWK